MKHVSDGIGKYEIPERENIPTGVFWVIIRLHKVTCPPVLWVWGGRWCFQPDTPSTLVAKSLGNSHQ